MAKIERIILHWTGGADGVNEKEEESYNAIITRDGRVVEGKFKAEAQQPPLIPGHYAAHTLHCNSYSFGVALDAMAGAVESPFDLGKYPITSVQLDCMAKYVAKKCVEFGIIVGRRTVLTHAEVQPTLNIQQRNKWDITWLPQMVKPGDPIKVGDMLRDMIIKEIDKDGTKAATSSSTTLSYPLIMRGSQGPFVYMAQELLSIKGYDIGSHGADGLFGGDTYRAVQQFQRDHGLKDDGKIGTYTWAALKKE